MLANDLVKTLIAPEIAKDAHGTLTALSAGMTIHATRVDL
jgi:hypothetical protein